MVGRPSIGFQPQMIVVPTHKPTNSDRIVCFVINAIPMATSGGRSDKKPYSIVILLLSIIF